MEEEIPISVSGKIREKDFVRSQWLHLRPGPLMTVVGLIPVTIFAVASSIGIVAWLFGQVSGGLVVFLSFLASMPVLLLVYLSVQFKRAYRSNKGIKVPFDIEITETGFYARSEYGEVRLPWDMFVRFKRNKHLLLLYQSSGAFHLLPGRLFASESEFDRAGDIFARRVSSEN